MPVIPLVPSDSPTLISSLLRLSANHLALAALASQPLKSGTLSLYISVPVPVLTGADPENELGGGQFRGSPAGSRGGGPVGSLGGQSSPEADDFSQLKGYLDVTSGIFGGGAWPLASPLKSARDFD